MEHALTPFVSEFFTGLGISVDSLSIEQTGDDINLTIKTNDSALLIGMHGKNIEVFQHLLSRIIERKLSKFVHVHLEVNDYIKQKEEKLFRFLDSKIAIIRSTGNSIRMPSLSPYERKKAHGYIADKNIVGLKTQSEWEGESRTLVLLYTGDLIDRIHVKPTPSTPPKHNEITISDEGVGI